MSYQSFIPFTVSGSTSFTLTASELIENALDVLQVGVDGEGVEPEYYSRGLLALNLVLRELQAQGLHIASFRTGYVFPPPGSNEMIVEDVKATNVYYDTTLSANATSPTTSITVTDSTNMAVGDTIGILKNDSTLFWSTISSITPTVAPAATIVIADSLDGDADSGCEVFNYTNSIQPIDRVLKISRRDNFTTDSPISMLSRDEYESLPYKSSNSGAPSLAYYWRSLGKGTLFLWPPVADSTYIIRLWYEQRIDDLKNPTDLLDLDRMYLPVVVHTLALRMCARLGISTEIYQRVKMEQQEIMANALSFDDEVEPIKVSLQRSNW